MITSVKELEIEIRYLDELKASVSKHLQRSKYNQKFVETQQTFLKSLHEHCNEYRKFLFIQEKIEGCCHCGAQYNEDCRVDKDIGYCIFADEVSES